MNSSDLADGQKVDVYWNFHKKCFSVRSRERDSYGRVVSHSDQIYLRSATLIVSQSGRKRVLCEKRKNVHAVIRGVWSASPVRATVPVSYDPYHHEEFMANGRPLRFSPAVMGHVDNGHPIVFADAPPLLN